jgi:hypothetical protein
MVLPSERARNRVTRIPSDGPRLATIHKLDVANGGALAYTDDRVFTLEAENGSKPELRN